MPKLKNPRHERFALELVKGHSAVQAYKNAGFAVESEGAAHAGASRLLKTNETIKLRMRELRNEIAQTFGTTVIVADDVATRRGSVAPIEGVKIDKAWLMAMLARNARIAMGDEKVKLTVPDKNAQEGTRVVEVTDRDAQAANRALELIGKTAEIRAFVEQHEHGGAGAFSQLTDAQLRETILAEAEKIGQADIVDAVRKAVDGPTSIN